MTETTIEISEAIRDREKRVNFHNLEQAVLMDNLPVEALSLVVSGIIDLVKSEKRRKSDRERAISLALEVSAIERYREAFDQAIADLEARIELLTEEWELQLKLAELAFERMHEAEDLLEAIKDGITKTERDRLVDLLGARAANASADELTAMLLAFIEEEHQTGLDRTNDAEGIEKRIEERKKQLDELQDQRAALESAQTHDERLAAVEAGDNSLSLVTESLDEASFAALDDVESVAVSTVNLDFDLSGLR